MSIQRTTRMCAFGIAQRFFRESHKKEQNNNNKWKCIQVKTTTFLQTVSISFSICPFFFIFIFFHWTIVHRRNILFFFRCCCCWCFCYRLPIRPVIKTNRNFSDRTFSFRILFAMNCVCILYDFLLFCFSPWLVPAILPFLFHFSATVCVKVV